MQVDKKQNNKRNKQKTLCGLTKNTQVDKMHPSQTFTSFQTNIMRAYTDTDLRFRVGLHRVDKRGDYNFQNVFIPSASSE